MSLESRLKKILGSDYGGPSLSYDEDNDEFILYDWFDAPVGTKILVRGEDLIEIVVEAEHMGLHYGLWVKSASDVGHWVDSGSKTICGLPIGLDEGIVPAIRRPNRLCRKCAKHRELP